MRTTPIVLAVCIALFAAADRSLAQTKPPAKGTVLITLGTRGGPLPTPGRTQSSNLLVVNGTPYLIDAGDGATRRIVRAGYEDCDPGKSNHGDDDRSNDERGGTPGNPGRKGGNRK